MRVSKRAKIHKNKAGMIGEPREIEYLERAIVLNLLFFMMFKNSDAEHIETHGYARKFDFQSRPRDDEAMAVNEKFTRKLFR